MMGRYETAEAKARHAEEQRRYRSRNPEKDKQSSRLWRLKNPEKAAAMSRKCNKQRSRNQVLEGKRRWVARHRERHLAQRAISTAVNKGCIQKPNSCSICGEIKEKRQIQGHHPDYKKRLEVIWVCHRCHERIHHGEN